MIVNSIEVRWRLLSDLNATSGPFSSSLYIRAGI